MNDLEKVIEGLEWILAGDRFGFGVKWETGEPRDDYEKAGKIITDAIALLKKQEPKNPRIDTIGQPVCPHEGCHHRLSLMLKQNYCDVCGQAVKWE